MVAPRFRRHSKQTTGSVRGRRDPTRSFWVAVGQATDPSLPGEEPGGVPLATPFGAHCCRFGGEGHGSFDDIVQWSVSVLQLIHQIAERRAGCLELHVLADIATGRLEMTCRSRTNPSTHGPPMGSGCT